MLALETERHPETVARAMPDAVVESSRERGWPGVELMVARNPARELYVDFLPTHTLAINIGRTYRLNGKVDGRRFDAAMHPGAMKLVAAGPSSRWHWDAGEPIEMLHVSVADGEIRAHAAEFSGAAAELRTRVGFDDARLLGLGRAFADAMRATPAGSLEAQALRLELVAALLADHSSLTGTSRIPSPGPRLETHALRRLEEFINAALGDEIRIADLAAIAGVSRFYFTRLFKATTGQSPYRYVLERRLDRARTLLRRGTDSIGDIAAATGFADQSHLTRRLKRRFGVTPQTYRTDSARMFKTEA